jgi:hypothetical protein
MHICNFQASGSREDKDERTDAARELHFKALSLRVLLETEKREGCSIDRRCLP